MRTILTLSDEQAHRLNLIAQTTGVSRAEVIRRAVDAYVARSPTEAAKDAAFGAWKARGVDALAYEERIRAEWAVRERHS